MIAKAIGDCSQQREATTQTPSIWWLSGYSSHVCEQNALGLSFFKFIYCTNTLHDAQFCSNWCIVTLIDLQFLFFLKKNY